MLTNTELVEKVVDMATNYKTLYVMDAFGAPLNKERKEYYIRTDSYNAQPDRARVIRGASEDTFGVDCCGLIKAAVWGWRGDRSRPHGGAIYQANGIPDMNANTMIQRSKDVSRSGWKDMIPGEALWMQGHIGVYIGNGLAVESSPVWKDGVQITAVANIGTKAGYPARRWTKHGKMPWIDYSSTLSIGDTVKVLKAETYDGKRFKTYFEEYTVKEVKNDRVVISKDGVIVAAVNRKNLQKV